MRKHSRPNQRHHYHLSKHRVNPDRNPDSAYLAMRRAGCPPTRNGPHARGRRAWRSRSSTPHSHMRSCVTSRTRNFIPCTTVRRLHHHQAQRHQAANGGKAGGCQILWMGGMARHRTAIGQRDPGVEMVRCLATVRWSLCPAHRSALWRRPTMARSEARVSTERVSRTRIWRTMREAGEETASDGAE